MRSSKYDDYKNGVDNVIVNKDTGDIVCAFDEVNDKKGGRRYQEKFEKVKRKAKKGGGKIKYGLTFEQTGDENKIAKREIKNIPTFYLALSTRELKQTLSGMRYNLNENPADIEIEIFDKLIRLLEEQTEILKKENIPETGKQNLEKFTTSLQRIKEIRGEF